jgi:predicted transcriptional regulator
VSDSGPGVEHRDEESDVDQQSGRDEEAVRRFVEHMSMLLAGWGFPRMAARVLMVMTAADEPQLTAGDLAERLGVSPAAISGAIRYLIQIGMAVREPVPGSRRDRYRLAADTWYEVTLTKLTMFGTVAELAAGGAQALGGPTSPSGVRVTEMRDYFLFVQKELPALLDKWLTTKPAYGEDPA